MPEQVRVERQAREERFWDEHVPPLEVCLRQYAAGPDPNTRALLDALEPLEGATALEIGCGAGVLSAWLAKRGARLTAVDISPLSISRAKEVAAALGYDIDFVNDGFPSAELDGRAFDRVAGRYVLHHLDLRLAVPALAARLAPGGIAAFVETMATNPILRASRKLAGRFGIQRFGTDDEQPLGRRDLARLSESIGPLRVVVAQMRFFRIFDRQVLRYRSGIASRLLGSLDDRLLALGLTAASYHQVIVLTAREAHGDDT
jgi:SAM-dependent methyltransferase